MKYAQHEPVFILKYITPLWDKFLTKLLSSSEISNFKMIYPICLWDNIKGNVVRIRLNFIFSADHKKLKIKLPGTYSYK